MITRDVIVYKRGLLSCSACAPAEMDGPAVAAAVEHTSPAGTEAGWQLAADLTFHGGEPIPCPCNTLPGRQHWLLEC